MKNEGGLKGKSAQMSPFGTQRGDESPVKPRLGLKTCKIFQVFTPCEEFNHHDERRHRGTDERLLFVMSPVSSEPLVTPPLPDTQTPLWSPCI